MQRTDFDFDVISGPSAPPLVPAATPRPVEPRPATTTPEPPLDPSARRPEAGVP